MLHLWHLFSSLCCIGRSLWTDSAPVQLNLCIVSAQHLLNVFLKIAEIQTEHIYDIKYVCD